MFLFIYVLSVKSLFGHCPYACDGGFRFSEKLGWTFCWTIFGELVVLMNINFLSDKILLYLFQDLHKNFFPYLCKKAKKKVQVRIPDNLSRVVFDAIHLDTFKFLRIFLKLYSISKVLVIWILSYLHSML